MNQSRPISRRDTESTWLRLVFLAILVVNLAIAAKLFVSVLNSGVTLLIIRVVIMATVLSFLLANSVRHP